MPRLKTITTTSLNQRSFPNLDEQSIDDPKTVPTFEGFSLIADEVLGEISTVASTKDPTNSSSDTSDDEDDGRL